MMAMWQPIGFWKEAIKIDERLKGLDFKLLKLFDQRY